MVGACLGTVALSNALAVSGGDTFFVDAVAVVFGLGGHGAQASAGVVADRDAEIADRAVVGVSTWREIGPVLVVQAVPLVDHV